MFLQLLCINNRLFSYRPVVTAVARCLRDWSLITGRGGGGLQNGRGGGHVKFYTYEKGGGAEKVLAMLKGGTKSFGVDFTW